MGKWWILAAVLLVLGGNAAFAEHGVTLEPDTAPVTAPAAPPAVVSETVTAPTAAPAPEPARQAEAAYPAELDVYVVPAATREICTIGEWGFDEIRSDCRTVALAPRRGNPALQGVCTTFYGRRTCY